MKQKPNKLIVFTLGIFLLGLSSLVWSGEALQDKDAKAYKDAYKFVMDEDWAAAAQSLDVFVRTYPQSAYVDDARFWRCYVREKTDDPSEEVFNCFQDFINTYPDSKWVDDAQKRLIAVAAHLAKE
jgi:TolA-binding protein